jgi:hypothetical protein
MAALGRFRLFALRQSSRLNGRRGLPVDIE